MVPVHDQSHYNAPPPQPMVIAPTAPVPSPPGCTWPTYGMVLASVANGVGVKGGWIVCNYRMNTATQGTGTCKLHNGAQFSMHVGG